MELLRSQRDLESVYVPVGLGSGICGLICARNALGLNAETVGVVSSAAECYAQSLAVGECRSTPTATTLADGLAGRLTQNKRR